MLDPSRGFTFMDIEKLPPLSQVAYLDCQYFLNEGGKGTAKNVLKFQYRTTTGADESFLVKLSTNKQRNLLKKLVKIAGKTKGDTLMKAYQDLKQDCDQVFIGFREYVKWVQNDPFAPAVRKARNDQFSVCWMTVKDGKFMVHLDWCGANLSMPAMTPTRSENPRASKLISYYHPQHDLNRAIAERIGKARMANSNGEPNRTSASACSAEQPAATDWKRQASDLGSPPQTSLAEDTTARARLIPSVVVEQDDCHVLDSELQAFAALWGCKPAPRVPVGLGTSIRL